MEMGKEEDKFRKYRKKKRGDWKERRDQKKEVWKVEAGSGNNSHKIQRCVASVGFTFRSNSQHCWFLCIVCAKQADIGILLDHSTSIVDPTRGGFDNWDIEVKKFLYHLIDAFPIGPTLTRIGIAGFSSSAWKQFGFNDYNISRTLRTAVRDMDIRGGETNIAQVTSKQNTSSETTTCYVRVV